MLATLQAVLNSMIDLLHKHLFGARARLSERGLVGPFDSHAQGIGRALQEREVVLSELAFRPTVHLEHTVRSAVALRYPSWQAGPSRESGLTPFGTPMGCRPSTLIAMGGK